MGSIFARAAPHICFLPSACPQYTYTSIYHRHHQPTPPGSYVSWVSSPVTSTLTGRLSGSVWIKFWDFISDLVVSDDLGCSRSALIQEVQCLQVCTPITKIVEVLWLEWFVAKYLFFLKSNAMQVADVIWQWWRMGQWIWCILVEYTVWE